MLSRFGQSFRHCTRCFVGKSHLNCITSLRNRFLSSSHPTLSISKLQDAFKDPNSPFYLAPGTEGPADPGAGFINPERAYHLENPREPLPGDNIDPLEKEAEIHATSAVITVTDKMRDIAHATLKKKGFDPTSFYEQTVAWGDIDSFRHVNNTRYVRYLESGRIVWMYHLAVLLGGVQLARDMISGRGVSLILKDISVRYRRPVIYPDTLLIAHKPHDSHPTHFSCAATVWSYSQQAVVVNSDSTLVWYDYDRLKKCDPGEEKRSVLEKRIRSIEAASKHLD